MEIDGMPEPLRCVAPETWHPHCVFNETAYSGPNAQPASTGERRPRLLPRDAERIDDSDEVGYRLGP
jgi:hypothetical protein